MEKSNEKTGDTSPQVWTRRNFIKKVGLTAAGSAVAGPFSAMAQKEPARNLSELKNIISRDKMEIPSIWTIS